MRASARSESLLAQRSARSSSGDCRPDRLLRDSFHALRRLLARSRSRSGRARQAQGNERRCANEDLIQLSASGRGMQAEIAALGVGRFRRTQRRNQTSSAAQSSQRMRRACATPARRRSRSALLAHLEAHRTRRAAMAARNGNPTARRATRATGVPAVTAGHICRADAAGP